MTDPFKLFLGVLASLFRSRAKLEAENLVLRQQINVLRRRIPKRPDLNNTYRFLFVWLYRWFPSVPGCGCDRQGRKRSFAGTVLGSGVLALAVAQPCWRRIFYEQIARDFDGDRKEVDALMAFLNNDKAP
jgi:hypothetical protein